MTAPAPAKYPGSGQLRLRNPAGYHHYLGLVDPAASCSRPLFSMEIRMASFLALKEEKKVTQYLLYRYRGTGTVK